MNDSLTNMDDAEVEAERHALRPRTRIIRLGRCRLWLRDGEKAKLDVTTLDGETWRGHTYGSLSSAPKLPGWTCYFVARYGDRTTWTYRRPAKVLTGPAYVTDENGENPRDLYTGDPLDL